MKRTNINTQQTHFIGSWNLENKKLCNEIISFFENNKNLQKPGVSGKGKDPKIKKTKVSNGILKHKDNIRFLNGFVWNRQCMSKEL